MTQLEALREIYEVYAGSEGLPEQTASEAYLVRLIKQMANIAARALEAAASIPKPPISGVRQCTCHPDDNPPIPCPQKYALSDCRAAVEASKEPK